jgi:allantoate deiminase
VALVHLLDGGRVPFSIEVVGFSEEEGVRFGVPFIGSRALAGTLDRDLLNRADATGARVVDAIRAFGLDEARIPEAHAERGARGYLEFHIEQGPVLDGLGLPLGIVEAIAGQSRLDVTFSGASNHAGTTPMDARRDALAGAAEWIVAVERHAHATPGLVATVGWIAASPGATNVIAGSCHASLDVRHADDEVRRAAVTRLTTLACDIAATRSLSTGWETRVDQPAVKMDTTLVDALTRAVTSSGAPVHRMVSGAGHDAMIVASCMPAAMLFVRSPRGISHHPDETVIEEDVAAALSVGREFLDELARAHP